MTAEQLEEILGKRADPQCETCGRNDVLLETFARRVIAADRVASWLRSCLDCPAFKWDEDQREMAEIELAAYREASK